MKYNSDEILEIYENEKSITSVAKEYCRKNNLEYTDSIRRSISSVINRKTDRKKDLGANVTDKDVVYDNMPSAWDSIQSKFYSIDEYCDRYGLPKENVKYSKLVAHQGGHMVYNITFYDDGAPEGIDYEVIESVVRKHIEPVNTPQFSFPLDGSKKVTNLTITDAHIGLEPNKEGNSLYGGKWDAEVLERRRKETVNATVNYSLLHDSTVLFVRDLGDLADGLNGQTVRGGHELPQNMSNVEVFDVAVGFKVKLIDDLVASGVYSEINLENVCNSNHGGDFDYFINRAVEEILEVKYPSIVLVNNHRGFISHYSVGNHCFIISHGKDDKTLKFGFKPFLDSKGLEKIDHYIKEKGLYKKYDHIHFCKGDSHQFLLDFSTSSDFDYFNYPAFSPSSQWVQNNFKKGISGFVLESFHPRFNEIDFSYKKFNWEE